MHTHIYKLTNYSRKYKKKYGTAKYLKYYVPLLTKFNGDLAGINVSKGDDDEERWSEEEKE